MRKPAIVILSALVSVGFAHALAAEGKGSQDTDVTLTPTKPHQLPDQSTRIVIGKETVWENRTRFAIPKLVRKDLTLDIAPKTVIASGGYLFHLGMPYVYKFGHIREEDMIFTVVDSCKISVCSERAKAPRLQLKKLKGTLSFACDNRQSSQIKNIHGTGKHFVALRVGRTEIYRRHPSKVLGTGMDISVVTNFGAKKIRLEYMQEQVVTIGPEAITIKSSNFVYATKLVDIEVSTKPTAAEAEALIVEYDNDNVERQE